MAILAFGFTFMNNWMRAALYGPSGRSWLRAVLVSGASSLLLPGVTFGVCLWFSGEVWLSMKSVLPMLPWAVLLMWVPVAVIAYMTEMKQRYRREWDSLQIS